MSYEQSTGIFPHAGLYPVGTEPFYLEARSKCLRFPGSIVST